VPFDVAQTVADIRNRLGNPLPAEISDTAIENAINASLVEYSRFRPRKKVVTIQLVPGQDFYPLEHGVIGVVDCILSFKGDTDADYYISPDIPVNAYENPWKPDPLDDFELDQRDIYDGYDWEYYPDTNQLRIVPAPDFYGVTEATVELMWEPSNFPNKEYETMMLFALAEAAEILGRFRSKLKEVPTGVGYKMTLDSGETLRAEALKKKEEFYRRLQQGGSVVKGG